MRSWAFFYTSRCFPPCSPLQREVYVCSILGLGTGSVGVFRCMFSFSSLRRRGQGRIYNSCSWISPDWSFRVLGEGEGNHGRGGHMTRVSPLCPSLLSTWQRHWPPSLMDRTVAVMSRLWQCPHISYHIVWNEPSWNGCGCAFLQQILLRREICTCLELASHLEGARGDQTQRVAHPGWLLPKLLTKDICEAVIHSGEMWKWAPAESPSRMIPLGCEPGRHNLFALFMHSSSLELLDWVVRRVDTLVCIPHRAS